MDWFVFFCDVIFNPKLMVMMKSYSDVLKKIFTTTLIPPADVDELLHFVTLEQPTKTQTLVGLHLDLIKEAKLVTLGDLYREKVVNFYDFNRAKLVRM